MTTLTRRKALTAIPAAAACAALPLAAFSARAEATYTPLEYSEYARHLWQQYIEASKAWMESAEAHEQAESEAKYDIAELGSPWHPRGVYTTFESKTDSSGQVHSITRVDMTGIRPCPHHARGELAGAGVSAVQHALPR